MRVEIFFQILVGGNLFAKRINVPTRLFGTQEYSTYVAINYSDMIYVVNIVCVKT